MTTWQERLFSEFVVGAHEIIVVADPDHLLRNPESLRLLTARGFDVLIYGDPIEFRYAYEIGYRAVRDQRSDRGLIVAFEPDESGFEVIPYDILLQSRKTGLGLKDIFPLLDYEVLRGLDSQSYDSLYKASQGRTSSLGRRETAEFVLQHAYGIVPSLVMDNVSFLRVVISMHYTRKALPHVLHDELLSILDRSIKLSHWPIRKMLTSATYLWGYLQERWKLFIERTHAGLRLSVHEPDELMYAGPIEIPFEHPDIRIYIDNLFQEGILTPITWRWEDALPVNWIKVGLSGDEQQNLHLRFQSLAQRIDGKYPDKHSAVRNWSLFAFAYHQLLNLYWQLNQSNRDALASTRQKISNETNQAFDLWMRAHYNKLFNASPIEPVMVHHVPHYISAQRSRGLDSRWAMVVVDGMSLGQWLVLKEDIKVPPSYTFEESGICACIPTITPVSRQSLYSGRLPLFFPETIDRTDKDASHWRAFWEGRGVNGREVEHTSFKGEESELADLETILQRDPQVLAVTVMKIDKIMHGMQLGTEGMWNQCVLWRNMGWLSTVISLLVSRGFNIVITSDHGNTEGKGVGALSEGSLTENSGQRCRVYRSNAFAEDFAAKHSDVGNLVESSLLPPDYKVIATQYGKAFVNRGQTIVAHGGCSLEEVLVPFIKLYRK